MNDAIKQPLIDRIRGILQAEGLTAAGSQDLAQAIVAAAEALAQEAADEHRREIVERAETLQRQLLGLAGYKAADLLKT